MFDYNLLNEKQKQAVSSLEKHLRIVAGAGSGKTRVLTERIAFLIKERQVLPFKILAITFTNKAAKEMKHRVISNLNDVGTSVWISTIHSLCMRILIEDIDKLGYPKNFTICDSEDQKTILKEVYKKLDISKNDYSFTSMLAYISGNKCAGVSPTDAFKYAYNDFFEQIKAKAYKLYEERLNQTYSLDFDDLILYTIKLFQNNNQVLTKWSSKFEHILVDEFQDIDQNQYQLIKMLSLVHDNIYVVGDPDQTIYTWRGADVNIILNLNKDFKDIKTIFLNQNYRSTNNILKAANALISNNKNRLEKELYSLNGDGIKIEHKTLSSEMDEAYFVSRKISELKNQGISYKDIACLYRSNYLSKNLEKALIENSIPYVIYGGIRFYERSEIKDMLSYLRLIVSNNDLAFKRIINMPRRGIGAISLENILNLATEHHLTMYEVVSNHLYNKNKEVFEKFVSMVENWRKDLNILSLENLLQKVLDDSGYRKMLEDENENERLENIKTLIEDIVEYQRIYPDSNLSEYLMMISLYVDKASENVNAECVSLMSVHAAKGLEFDNVFVIGMSQGVFPSNRSLTESLVGIEEERRLAYVAFTRAGKRLCLTDSNDYSFILNSNKVSSCFINEIPKDYIEDLNVSQTSNIYKHFEDLAQETVDYNYKVQDKVISSIFGKGVIVDIDDDVLTIAFEYNIGIKKILSYHPSIKKDTSSLN